MYPGCYSGGDIAIAVVVSTLIECLLAAPVITAVMVFCWKRNQRYITHSLAQPDSYTLGGGGRESGRVLYIELSQRLV